MRSPSLVTLVLGAALLAVPLRASEPAGPQIQDKELFGKSLGVAGKAVELFGESKDRAERERVAEIGYRVAQASNFRELPFTFYVIDMPQPNAFALPGGQIFVTSSMLAMGLSDDMLAGLLGHEVAHVVAHHGTRIERRETLLKMLGQALVVGVLVQVANERERDRPTNPYDPRAQDNPQGDMVQGAAATSLLVSELLLRGYSRDFEREADDEGQRFAAGAGFSPGGLRELMALMQVRLPQSKSYGYWQTHPFFDERVRGAEVRTGLLTAQPPRSTDDYRQQTQEVLLAYLESAKLEEAEIKLLKGQILSAWPRGEQADKLRLAALHEKKDAELKLIPVSRDYGALLTAYRDTVAEVERLAPASPLLATLKSEISELEAGRGELYATAQKTLAGEVFETGFLERFLSNFPTSPEAPRAALALGDAYSRLGRQSDAVAQYLAAAKAPEGSAERTRARAGLRNLAPVLDSLAALALLATEGTDPELGPLARARLDTIAGTFADLANGAEYLKKYPGGAKVEVVTDRLNVLADQLYTEVILYQGVGDSVKALDRINSILTHAPGSQAASRLREKAVVEES